MGVKDERLLEGQLGRGEFARFETPIEQAGNSQRWNFKLQTPNPQKKEFWWLVLVWKKEHRSGFCRSGHVGRKKAFKKR